MRTRRLLVLCATTAVLVLSTQAVSNTLLIEPILGIANAAQTPTSQSPTLPPPTRLERQREISQNRARAQCLELLREASDQVNKFGPAQAREFSANRAIADVAAMQARMGDPVGRE